METTKNTPIVLGKRKLYRTFAASKCKIFMTQRNEIIERLRAYKRDYAQKYGIRQLGLFGSYARGEQTETSDVDVFVDLSTPTLHILCTIHDDLEKLFGLNVDLIRLRKNINRKLALNIEKDGILA